MGTIECSQTASKSSWDSQDFGDISMVLKMAHFHKSTGPRWVNMFRNCSKLSADLLKVVVWLQITEPVVGFSIENHE